MQEPAEVLELGSWAQQSPRAERQEQGWSVPWLIMSSVGWLWIINLYKVRGKWHISLMFSNMYCAGIQACKFVLTRPLFSLVKMDPWASESQHVHCCFMQNLAQTLFESTSLNMLTFWFGAQPSASRCLVLSWIFFYYLYHVIFCLLSV